MPDQEFNVTGASPVQSIDNLATPPPTAGANLLARLGAWKQGNVLLAVLFVAGIGCVYLLSLRNGPARASAQQKDEELKVETALTQIRVRSAQPPAGRAANTNVLVDTFYYETRQRQIPAEELPDNPFEFTLPAAKQSLPVSVPSEEGESNAVGAKRLSEALDAVQQLKLQSVLAGTGGATAMISNNLLTEGQSIAGWTITKIEGRQVMLTWGDQTYTLKMP